MVHSGGMGGGHYVAYAKHETKEGPKWFYFSDSYWKEVSIQNVANA
jgi:ubiquitin C-terminal hydrolase